MTKHSVSKREKGTRLIELIILTVILVSPVHAQDEDLQPQDQRRANREEFLSKNPEAAARMEQRREHRDEMIANNPEAAARMRERRETLRNDPEHRDAREAMRKQRKEAGENRPRRPEAER